MHANAGSRKDRRAYIANDRCQRVLSAVSMLLPEFAAEDLRLYGDMKMQKELEDIVAEAREASKGPMAHDSRFKRGDHIKKENNEDDDTPMGL